MNSISIFDNFLTDNDYLTCINQLENASWNYSGSSYSSNNAVCYRDNLPGRHLLPNISKTIANNFDVCVKFWNCDLNENEFFSKYLLQYIENKVERKFTLERVYANGHTYGDDGSYHLDSCENDAYTFLLFANEIPNELLWIAKGCFEIQEPSESFTRCYQPVKNRGILFHAKQLHRGNSFSRFFPNLRITVAWKLRLMVTTQTTINNLHKNNYLFNNNFQLTEKRTENPPDNTNINSQILLSIKKYKIINFQNINISIIENAIDIKVCDYLCNFIDESKLVKIEHGKSSNVESYNVENISNQMINNYLVNILEDIMHNVLEQLNIPASGYQSFQLRKVYGCTRIHTDGACPNGIENVMKDKIRTATIIFCLNDDFEGGVYDFPLQRVKFKPTKGSAIIFPPYWTHKHMVTPIIQGSNSEHKSRYIFSSWYTEK